MNRRGFFGAFAAAPLVALGARAALSGPDAGTPAARVAKAALPPHHPIKGEIQHMMNTGSSAGYIVGYDAHTPQIPSHSHSFHHTVAVPALYIWTGEAWVAYDSFEGVAVRNEMLRQRGQPT